MIILIEQHYPTEQAVFDAYAEKFRNLCNAVIQNAPHRKLQDADTMTVDVVAEVAGTWECLTFYYKIRSYEVTFAEPDEVQSDTIEDYYGCDTIAALKEEYGAEIQPIDKLTDDELKAEIEFY